MCIRDSLQREQISDGEGMKTAHQITGKFRFTITTLKTASFKRRCQLCNAQSDHIYNVAQVILFMYIVHPHFREKSAHYTRENTVNNLLVNSYVRVIYKDQNLRCKKE